jgi:hypoxanthine phosphoribosyltransferase
MLTFEEANNILRSAEPLFSAREIAQTIRRMATEITEVLADDYPVVLSVMGGAVVFTGHLLPLLEFPLTFDYLHVSRYANSRHGGEIRWKMRPQEDICGRVVLVLDDILDEGMTLAAIRDWAVSGGASRFYSAVLVEKEIGRPKPIHAEFTGITLPDRYVFGFGMDINGAWRNLPAIYTLKDKDSERRNGNEPEGSEPE